MSTQDVRDTVVGAWSRRLRQLGIAQADYLALELAVIAEGFGVRLTAPALVHDPVAEDWKPGRRPVGRPPSDYYLQLTGRQPEDGDDVPPGQTDLFDLIERTNA